MKAKYLFPINENVKIRTRFAPSPTGFLHLGGARTALYSWLFAKQHGGEFILRIEDTDLERSTQQATDAILESMQWLGLNWDFGPYFQTKRFDRYNEVIEQMLENGTAYRCYCTKERLENLRAEQEKNKQKTKYDGHCLHNHNHDPNQPCVIRFKNPTEGAVVFDDLIRGKISVNNSELDDLIIRRTDGSPTYNFCVVVDDWDMGITHIVRGEDHINNTPRQINILKALGAEIPVYAHVSMINGDDGQKLSKRHGAVSVMQYRDLGVLPEALINYLARLGWGYQDQEIFSIEEMKKLFDLKQVSKSSSSFNTQKLFWLNHHYLTNTPIEKLEEEFKWQLNNLQIDYAEYAPFKEIIKLFLPRCQTLRDLALESKYLFNSAVNFDENAVQKHFVDKANLVIENLINELQSCVWELEAIKSAMQNVRVKFDLKMAQVGMPFRVALTGGANSPAIDEIALILGRDAVLQRLNNALEVIAQLGE